MNSKTKNIQLSQNHDIIRKKIPKLHCLPTLGMGGENSQQLKITKIYDLSEVLMII